MRRALYGLLSLTLVFGLVQCGAYDDGSTDPGPEPNQSPTATIASPDDGATFDVGAAVVFEGSASDPEDGNLSGGSLAWSSDVDGGLGTGTSVTVNDLSEGAHQITFEATDSEGATDSDAVSITVGEQADGNVVDMTIDDDQFIDPDGNVNTNATVTIDLGGSVRWTYVSSGSDSHTVTSGEGIGGNGGDGVPEGGTAFASPEISPGGTFEVTPDAPGTWTYYCEIHPGIMYEATIIVNE